MRTTVNMWEWLMDGINKFGGFQSNEFWKKTGCFVSAPKFGIGRSRLLEKDDAQKIIGKKRKIH